ncbi:hypothetical protein [Methanobrevibacter millerae]|uniref:Uncharacterized protein n=1 Tax=Methanobrevibacter millerae TaxID=230361 RepID=A0A1G5V0C6_9EURY|nr:hypothetical protein [Methanobrevibacter millerae]SDA39341.1 hypothetical protein SAMN02910315_00247 [Methanobrevibacter millerae]
MECTYFQRYGEKIVSEGINKNNIEIAKKLKKYGDLSNEKIAKITKLDLKTVEEL